jgi:hypothetical protein
MDQNTLIAVVVIAIVAIVGFALYRNAKGKISAGPVSAEFEGSNAPDQPVVTAPSSGISVKDAKSTGGSVMVSEQAGGSVEVERVEAKKDINVTRTDGSPPPKA